MRVVLNNILFLTSLRNFSIDDIKENCCIVVLLIGSTEGGGGRAELLRYRVLNDGYVECNETTA